MAHAPYATLSEATECLVDAIGIVRQGWDNVIAQKAAMGEHEHAVQGYIHSVVLGTTEGPFGAPAAEDELEFGAKLEEFADALHAARPDTVTATILAEVKTPNQAASASGIGARVDWKKWLNFFLTVVLPLIMES